MKQNIYSKDVLNVSRHLEKKLYQRMANLVSFLRGILTHGINFHEHVLLQALQA